MVFSESIDFLFTIVILHNQKRKKQNKIDYLLIAVQLHDDFCVAAFYNPVRVAFKHSKRK